MSPLPPQPETEPSWDHFVRGLRTFVARRVPTQDAEDVAQEALLRLHQNSAGLRQAHNPQGWVFTVARRTIADYYRARRPLEIVDSTELDSRIDDAAGIEEALATFDGDHSVHEEVLSWLRPIAEGLPSGYRDAPPDGGFRGLAPAPGGRRPGSLPIRGQVPDPTSSAKTRRGNFNGVVPSNSAPKVRSKTSNEIIVIAKEKKLPKRSTKPTLGATIARSPQFPRQPKKPLFYRRLASFFSPPRGSETERIRSIT